LKATINNGGKTMEAFNEQAKQHFEEHGYVIFEGVLSEEEVGLLRGIVLELAEWEREQGSAFLYGDNKLQRVWNLINKHEIFRELIQKPLIVEVIGHLLGEKFVLRSWTANIVGGGGDSGGLHIDTHIPGDNPVPAFLLEANTMWLLDDFTEFNGATLCLPGSHRSLKKPQPEDQQREDLVKMLAPKGSVIVTHGALWHRSGQNQTDQARMVLLGSFAPAFVRGLGVQEEHLLIIDKEIIEQATPLLQQMIGVGLGIQKGALQKPPQNDGLTKAASE
jgi:ectoine hydroxylase-related dioxygenase (phytanoyl-CoA dioxygenase family)